MSLFKSEEVSCSYQLLRGEICITSCDENELPALERLFRPGLRVRCRRTVIIDEVTDITEEFEARLKGDSEECRARVAERRLEWNE